MQGQFKRLVDLYDTLHSWVDCKLATYQKMWTVTYIWQLLTVE